LLFVNAHLAGKFSFPNVPVVQMLDTNVAHEGKLPNRLANMAKIKVCSPHFSQVSHLLTNLAQNELAVDDFLEADDPRMVAEGLVPLVYSIE
jgi:hypothetical protein